MRYGDPKGATELENGKDGACQAVAGVATQACEPKWRYVTWECGGVGWERMGFECLAMVHAISEIILRLYTWQIFIKHGTM